MQEVKDALGEDSEFHESHGFYLDPISCHVLILSPGWIDWFLFNLAMSGLISWM